jgi:hypothetical protein
VSGGPDAGDRHTPTAVFVGKLMVFTAAVEGGFAWLAVVAILNTVASVFYYLRWIAPAAGAVLPLFSAG